MKIALIIAMPLLLSAGLLACVVAPPAPTTDQISAPGPVTQIVVSPLLPTRAVTPTPTPRPTRTPIPPSATPAGALVTPFAEGQILSAYAWSPDSEWLAYFSFRSDEMPGEGSIRGLGQLHFHQPRTGLRCQYALAVGVGAELEWLNNGEVIVFNERGAWRGLPCDTAPLRVTSRRRVLRENEALSPDGGYRVLAVTDGLPDGTLQVWTTFSEAQTEATLRVVRWRTQGGVGTLGVGGQWLDERHFLISETLDQGPLLIRDAREVIPVLPELFGESLPASTAATRPRVWGWPARDRDMFFLSRGYTGEENRQSRVALYRSDTGSVEQLPFRDLWAISPDGRWLITDKRPTVRGYETSEFWFRAVDAVEAPFEFLLDGSSSSLSFSPGWERLASARDDTPFSSHPPAALEIRSFPERALLSVWRSEDYSLYPRQWSPNGRWLIADGYLWRGGMGLFMLKLP